MQGLHLTGDLFDCGCSGSLLTDAAKLADLCREQTLAAGLTTVAEQFHAFPEHDSAPGGVTGTLLLAESHLAVHTWPERRGVTLDVYVCNFTADNDGKARRLFEALLVAFRPRERVVNRIARGDLARGKAPSVAAGAGPAAGGLVFDWLNADAGYGFAADAVLATVESRYQRIEIYDTPQFGRLLRLDGRMMTSERDEFFYHECMVHPAAVAHPDPRNALVIGGGDGGSAEELLKHPRISRVLLAELDAAVIDVARSHLAAIHRGALDDPRVEIRVGDGRDTVRACNEQFDLIVLDLTDADTPASGLYTEAFFRLCRDRLAPGGMMTLHLGSPVYQPDAVRRHADSLHRVFDAVHPMSVFIPLYGSAWCLAVVGQGVDPRLPPAVAGARLAARPLPGLQYYDADVHGALFALPVYLRELTRNRGGASARFAA
ncbi:MAG TPA: polyamine aminopropyltransferase [Burkholderiaceae bacterium]|nr:polyamine aminopropyltransferase [Burkholderiaceae bacterium]